MTTATTETQIWDAVQSLNRAWTVDRHPERLRQYFHPTMVTIAPDQTLRLEGGAACVDAWTQYATSVKIRGWKELDPGIHVYHDTFAVVTYYFELECEMGGAQQLLKGRDMMALVKEGTRWWVVADQFSPFPPKP